MTTAPLNRGSANGFKEVSIYSDMESDQTRKLRLLLLVCRICLVIMGVGIVATFLSALSNQNLAPESLISSFVAFIAFAMAYQVGKSGKLVLGSWLVIGGALLVLSTAYISVGTAIPFMVFFLIPMFLSALLLDRFSVVLTTGYSVLFTVTMFFLQDVTGIYTPPQAHAVNSTGILITNLIISIFLLPALVIIVVVPTRGQARALQAQNHYLRQTLQQLELRQHTGETVSQQVLQLAAELKITANQQAGGSQEQAGTVEQVNVSVSELSNASSNIADLVVQVNNSVDIIGMGSQLIEDTTTLSLQQSEAGIEAVQQTVQVSQEVGTLYQELLGMLDDLNTKNSNMRLILQILTSVSSETHLLALNAAIEAAGAGEYGTRFAVVAQEVKELAARSSTASQQVVGIIEQIQRASQIAIHSANQGYQKAQQMQHVVEQAGKTIGQLSEVCQQSQLQASEINQATQEVKELTQTIKIATFQQRTASEQVLNALAGLRVVAEQNAESSYQVSSTANNLEEMSHNLTLALMN